MEKFQVNKRNPYHWDVTGDFGRFAIRGELGHIYVRDERSGQGSNNTSEFASVCSAMTWICDMLMREPSP